MSIKEQFERISYIANVCRTENEHSELQYMLNELDSTISDMYDELFGQEELDKWLGNMSTKELGDVYHELIGEKNE